MKRFLRYLGFTFAFLLGLVIILMVIAKLSENKISKIALQKVSDNYRAPMTINDVSLNLLRQFPRASIELNGVTFCGQTDSLSHHAPDTLLQLQNIFVAVKSKPLMKGIIEVLKVELRDGHVNFTVNKNGESSIDFLMASADTATTDTTAGTPLHVTLNEFSAKNLTCFYRDSMNQVTARVKIPELEIDGKIRDKTMEGSARGQISFYECNMAQTPLHLMSQTTLDFDANYKNDSIAIKDFVLDTDGGSMSMLGGVKLGESIQTNLEIKESEFSISELMKYIPEKIIRELDLHNASGRLNMNGTVKGNYSENELPHVDMDVSYEKGNIRMGDYPEIRNLRFKGKITNGFLQNNQSTRLDFSNFSFETEQSQFDLSFSVLDIDKPKYQVKSKMVVVLDEFREYLPDSLIHDLSGQVRLNLSTKGTMPDTLDEKFTDFIVNNTTADMNFRNLNIATDTSLSVNNLYADIHYKPGRIEVGALSLQIPSYQLTMDSSSVKGRFRGNISRPSEMEVFLDEIQLRTPQSAYSGNLMVRNLEKPFYQTDSRIKLNLAEVKNMLPDTLATTMKGEVMAHINSSGRINPDSIQDQLMKLVFENGNYITELNKVSVSLPAYPDYNVSDLSGIITMNRDKVTVNKCSGTAAGISFAIDSTHIKNHYATLIKNQPEVLEVDTRIQLGELDYNHLMGLVPSDTSENSNSGEQFAPSNYSILMKGVAKAKSFRYDSVTLENISTLFRAEDSIYTLDQFQFDAFGGHLNTSANYALKPNDRAVIQMRNNISQMDIKKLLADFRDFEAFYEPSIRSENLSGRLTCDFYTKFDIIGDSLSQNSLRVRGDFTLEEGGVYNFEPATELSKKTSINELDNIQFKNLNSQVFILQGAIFVPKTYISSTALDITAFGMQEFGTDYEYHLKLHLSDILVGKSKKLLKEQEKMGDVVDKDARKNAVFMMLYSENGKTKTRFDKEKFKSAMELKIKIQQSLLNLRFHPEMFKFETGVYPNPSEKRTRTSE